MNCEHYERNCWMICPTCNEKYNCRLCHNDIWELKKDGHTLPRRDVREVVCKKCEMRQGVSNKCINCEEIFGKYYCDICHFWENRQKDIFHCDSCGICRIGRREEYVHCDICNACFPVESMEKHGDICRRNLFENDCAICMEEMGDSVKSGTVMRCGHIFHVDCIMMYMRQNVKCPLCRKIMVDKDNEQMRAYVEQMDELIRVQPLPEEMERKVRMKCVECGRQYEEVDWHPLGVKCEDCNVYNMMEI